MQYVDRSPAPVPDVFRGPKAQAMRAALLDFMTQRDDFRAQSTPPEQRLELGDDVREALAQLFRGKCAFCETKTSLGVHRLRPAAEAAPLARSENAHLYYCWLGTDWNNTYAICAGCNVSSARLFPVRGGVRGPLPSADQLREFAESNAGWWRWPHRDRPLVLDPCRKHDFGRYLAFDLSGAVGGKTVAGRETIGVFGLNRDSLTRARGAAFNEYLSLLRSGESGDLPGPAFAFANMEFGGAWRLVLRRLLDRISKRLGQPLSHSGGKLQASLASVLSTPIGRTAFEAALDEIALQEPEQRPPSRRKSVKPRRLVGVAIKDFKALEDLEIAVPAPIPADPSVGRPNAEAAALLVLGENAAGKSSILEATALALASRAVRARVAASPDILVLNPEFMGMPRTARPERASVALRFDDGGDFHLSIDSGFHEDGDADRLPAVFAYGAFRQFSEIGRRFPGGGSVATLFRSDISLRSPQEWLLGLDRARFALVARALKEVFSVEGEIEVIERDFANRRCLVVSEVGDGDDKHQFRTPLTVVSSGFRSVLAMVCDILEVVVGSGKKELTPLTEAEPVILIDEIEAHLHPRWKMQIMGALRRLLPSATFVVTTHDPLCLRGMHDGEVLVLRRVPKLATAGEGAMPVFVESVATLPNVEDLTVEQLLTSDFFDMFSTDSPEAERRWAELGSILARKDAGEGLSEADRETLQELEGEVSDVLPLGSSKVQRLVLDAVAVYLGRRRRAGGVDARRAFEDGTRDMIVDALEGYAR
jgi:hypothetical protein